MPSTMSSQEGVLLLEKSKELAVTLIPVLMFASFNMIFGMFGNSIVLYYYGRKTKTTPTNCFILALAAFDLLNCVLSMPMDHADLILYIDFANTSSCKILRFITFYTSIASGLTLLSIAIDRYRRICWPLSKQFSVRDARIVSMFCASIAAIVSWPALVFHVVEQVQVIYIDPRNTTHQVNITGYDCKLSSSDQYTPYILAFHVFHFILFVAVTVTLTVLYGLIGCKLLKLKRHYKSLKINNPRPRRNEQSVSVTLFPSSSLRNIYSIDENKTQMDIYKQRLHNIEDATDESVVSRDASVELIIPAEFRIPTDEKDRLKTSFSKECTSDLLHYRKVSRNNNVAILNLSQKKIKALRNRRMSWPYQTCQEHPEYSSSTLVKGSDKAPGDDLINSVWMPREGQLSLLLRSQSDCNWRKLSTEMHDDSEETECHERWTEQSKTQSLPFSRYVIGSKVNQINIDERSNKTGCPYVRSLFETIDSRTLKSTIIMFIVALVFVVSFLPYLCVAIWSLFLEGYEVNILTKEQFVAFNFGNLSYLINSSFNPLIYGIFNSKFRHFMYRNICCRYFRGQYSL